MSDSSSLVGAGVVAGTGIVCNVGSGGILATAEGAPAIIVGVGAAVAIGAVGIGLGYGIYKFGKWVIDS